MEQCQGHTDVRHVGCGGQLAIDGEGEFRMPLGFGFRQGAKGFVVDRVVYKFYRGFCLKCKKDGDFIRKDVKPRMDTVSPKLKGATK